MAAPHVMLQPPRDHACQQYRKVVHVDWATSVDDSLTTDHLGEVLTYNEPRWERDRDEYGQ